MPIDHEVIDPACCAVYLELPGPNVVKLQAYFDLYEDLGAVRTLDVKRSLVCVLTTPDMLRDCSALLHSLSAELNWRSVQRPEDLPLESLLGCGVRGGAD